MIHSTQYTDTTGARQLNLIRFYTAALAAATYATGADAASGGRRSDELYSYKCTIRKYSQNL